MVTLIVVITLAAALVTLASPIWKLVCSVWRKIGRIKQWLINLGRMPSLLEELLAKTDQINMQMQERDRAQVQVEEDLDALKAAKEDLDDARALWKPRRAKPKPSTGRRRH
jgi:hypothetical protein